MSEPMEWIDIQQDDFSVAFGRSTGDGTEIYLRVLGKKNGQTAHIEWVFDAAWLRDVLTRWFPPIPDSPAPRPPRES